MSGNGRQNSAPAGERIERTAQGSPGVATDALRASEARFRALVLSTCDVVYALSPDWSTLQPLDGRGLVPSSAEPQTAWKWFNRNVPPHERVRVRAAIDAAIAGKKPFQLEHQVFGPDGSLRRTFSRAVPILDGAGEIAEWFGAAADITDRKRAEEQVERNRQVFYELVERCPFGIYIVDADFRISIMNARSVDGPFSNVRPVIGRDFREVIRVLWPAPVASEVIDIFRRTLDTGEPYHSRHFVRQRADKDAVEGYEWELHRIVLSDGRFGVVCYFYDSTDLRQAQDRLRESRERMEVVVQGADVGVWYCPLPFDKLIWDETVKRHFHLPPDADVTIETFYERIHPEDRERTRTAIETSIRAKRPYDIDYRTVSPDGQHTKWIRASGRGFYDADGNPIRFDGITIDMTERIRGAEALRTSEARLVESQRLGHIGSWYWDARTDATVGSEELYRIFGLDPADGPFPPFKAQDGTIYPHESWAQVNAAVAETIRTRLGGELDVEARRGDQVIWVTTRCEIDLGPDGGVLGLRGTVQDITDRKRAEQERERLLDSERAARADAERTSRMKDEFLATLSHELRTPLNAMLGWTQILRRISPTPEDYAEGLAIIERNCRNQAQLIEDLLDMSRIISGKIRLDVQRVQVADVIQAAADVVRPAAEAKKLRLSLTLDPNAGPVSGDPARLQQVLWNLLSNAIKFTPSGGRVYVTLERVNSHVEVSVADTGQGIGPEFLPHVFERFRQEDGSTTRQHGGLGLGLAIVKHLVELHGGQVRAKSAGQGRGATFVIHLPLAPLRVDNEDGQAREHPTSGESAGAADYPPPRLDGVKILVADDDPDARDILRRTLEGSGATVFSAGDADEALARLSQERPDVLLSDIGMPRVDGYELIRRVRQLPPDRGGATPAVAITAFARSEDRRRALLAGYQMHLAKPFDPDELLTVCASVAGRVVQAIEPFSG